MMAHKSTRWLGVCLLTGGAYLLWEREQQRLAEVPPMPADQAQALVARALPYLRLPTAPEVEPELAFDTNGDGKFIGLRCPVTHRIYLYRDRVLDLLEFEPSLTAIQDALNSPLRAWAYDALRQSPLVQALGLPRFGEEADEIAARLSLLPGDVVLDLCCGPGNFTAEWARRVGSEGLVLGLDLSTAMLRRAAYHTYQQGLDNVLLIRGDAQRLPLGGHSLRRVNCSGGLHQVPDLPQALRELARVIQPGGVLSLSALTRPEDAGAVAAWLRQRFQLNLVDLPRLGDQLAEAGFVGYESRISGSAWWGYGRAERSTPDLTGPAPT